MQINFEKLKFAFDPKLNKETGEIKMILNITITCDINNQGLDMNELIDVSTGDGRIEITPNQQALGLKKVI